MLCKACAVFRLPTDTQDRGFESLWTLGRNLTQTALPNVYKQGAGHRQSAESKPSGLKQFAHGLTPELEVILQIFKSSPEDLSLCESRLGKVIYYHLFEGNISVHHHTQLPHSNLDGIKSVCPSFHLCPSLTGL